MRAYAVGVSYGSQLLLMASACRIAHCLDWRACAQEQRCAALSALQLSVSTDQPTFTAALA